MNRSFGALKQASKSWLKRGLSRALQGGGSRPEGIAPAHWGLSRNAAGNLSLSGVDLVELTKRHGSPLHVVDASRLRDNARRFLARPPGCARGCEVFSSYKTNPVPAVLAELHAAGVGAEVISHYELWLALKLGVPPRAIVYNGPGKSEASIRQAVELGIELLNMNHREEIAVVARAARELGRRPRVGLRATIGGWSGQFGVPVAGDQALRAFEEALAAGCLDVVGLHVHRGGMIHTSEEVDQLLDGVLGFAGQLRERLGLALEILDIGGSLAPPSVRALASRELRLNLTFGRELLAPDPSSAITIEGYVGRVLERVERHYAERSEPAPRVFVEPGRALTSDTQLLLTQVLGTKRGEERSHAILDAGVNLAESCRSEYHQVFSVNRHALPHDRRYTLVGPICSPGDTLRWAIRLPELHPGDTLAIMDAGAYFVPFATSFSFPQPAIVRVDDGQATLIRRAETFDDLIAFDLPVDPAFAYREAKTS